mgnify:CR=1 FL=1
MLNQIRAELLALRSEVQRLRRMEIEGFTRRESAGGVTFGLGGRSSPATRFPDKFVAIIKTPLVADKTLRVRELKYKDPFPEPCLESAGVLTCQYDWADVAFEAHPLFGSTVMDYENEVLENGETVLTPPSDTSVMRCFRNHDSWIVERTKVSEGGGIKPAIVLAASGTGSTITVQPMKKGTNAAGHPDWVADGRTRIVPLWGDQTAADFTTFVTASYSLQRDMIPLIQVDGETYAMQYVWMQTGFPNPATPRGDCV